MNGTISGLIAEMNSVANSNTGVPSKKKSVSGCGSLYEGMLCIKIRKGGWEK